MPNDKVPLKASLLDREENLRQRKDKKNITQIIRICADY